MSIIPFYVYKITCQITNNYYFGSRYNHISKLTLPENDILVKYFTSSKYVKSLINLYGIEAFSAEILFTSTNKDETFWEEQKLIKDHIDDNLCLNKHWFDENRCKVFSFTNCNHSDSSKFKMSTKATGRTSKNVRSWTDEEKLSASQRMKQFWNDNPDKLIQMKENKQGFQKANPNFATNQGKKLSEKISKSPEMQEAYKNRAIQQHLKNPPNKSFICDQTGQIFNNAAEASRTLNIPADGIRKVLRKVCKAVKGYSFSYI